MVLGRRRAKCCRGKKMREMRKQAQVFSHQRDGLFQLERFAVLLLVLDGDGFHVKDSSSGQMCTQWPASTIRVSRRWAYGIARRLCLPNASHKRDARRAPGRFATRLDRTGPRDQPFQKFHDAAVDARDHGQTTQEDDEEELQGERDGTVKRSEKRNRKSWWSITHGPVNHQCLGLQPLCPGRRPRTYCNPAKNAGLWINPVHHTKHPCPSM
ncbi:hypothetical protein IWX47DRAFT_679942 [Phyllosticta citricarpa]